MSQEPDVERVDELPPLPFLVSICGIADLSWFAFKNVSHLLSVERSWQQTPTPKWLTGPHAHVVFDDVESEEEGRQRCTVPPTDEEIAKALEFGRACLDASRTQAVHLLIHCTQGASRSPALAFGILSMVLGPSQEQAALRHVLRLRPYAVPNRLVVRLADAALGRNGALNAVLKDLFESPERYRPQLRVGRSNGRSSSSGK